MGFLPYSIENKGNEDIPAERRLSDAPILRQMVIDQYDQLKGLLGG
jgi:hypothetical protein